MKKLGLIVIKAFIGPFILNFVIWMVILDMQFLWLYIDDLMGKGLEWYIILELLVYASANWVPVALPLSILLASIMTFGNLAEHNELTAMKASGLSLFKIMRPLTFFMLFISAFAFYFSNNLWPMANFKMRVLIQDIQNTKAAIVLKDGEFYNQIENFSIRVGRKDENGKDLYDLLIYDHSEAAKPHSYADDPRDYKRVIRAKKGRISQSDDKKNLVLNLEHGFILQEMSPESVKEASYPFMRYYFEKAKLNIRLKAFELERTDEDMYEKEEYLMSYSQIKNIKDSTIIEQENRNRNTATYLKNNYLLFRKAKDSIKVKEQNKEIVPTQNYFEKLTAQDQKKDVLWAISKVRNIQKYLGVESVRKEIYYQKLNKLDIEMNRKFTLAYAVMMLFFLGAPLGAIVRKGGIGVPVLIALLLFIIYFLITRMGEELSTNLTMQPIVGMWLSAYVLTPITIFVAYKSNADSKLFDKDFYLKIFRYIFIKKERNS